MPPRNYKTNPITGNAFDYIGQDGIDALQFNLNANEECKEGQQSWNDESGTIEVGMKGGTVCNQVGQEIFIPRAKNVSGELIANGTLVYVYGATGNNPIMRVATNTDILTAENIIAMSTEDIPDNQFGFYTAFGLVNDINTSSFSAGDKLYLGINGQPANIIPANNVKVNIGYCIRSSATVGSIFITIDKDFHKYIYVPTDSDLTIKCGSQKTVLLEQVVWEDLNFGVSSAGGPVATRPDDVTINNVFYKEFTSLNNQTCGDQKEVPHAACIDKNLKFYPHIHIFLKNGESAGTTGVSFTINWELRQNNNIVTNGSVVLSATSAQLAANSGKLDIYDNTGFNAPTYKGAQLSLRLSRTGGDAGDVIVITYGVHLAYDTIGSRAINAK